MYVLTSHLVGSMVAFVDIVVQIIVVKDTIIEKSWVKCP